MDAIISLMRKSVKGGDCLPEEKLEEEVQKMEEINGQRQEILEQMEQRCNKLNGNGKRRLFNARDKRSNTQQTDGCD